MCVNQVVLCPRDRPLTYIAGGHTNQLTNWDCGDTFLIKDVATWRLAKIVYSNATIGAYENHVCIGHQKLLITL